MAPTPCCSRVVGERDELPPLGQEDPQIGPLSMYRCGPTAKLSLLSTLLLLLLFTPKLLKLVLVAGVWSPPPNPCKEVDMAAVLCIDPVPNSAPPGELCCTDDCKLLAGDKFEAMACV